MMDEQMVFSSQALLPQDLYTNFIKKNKFRAKLSPKDCGNILAYFFRLVIDDVIDNNIIFKFPGLKQAYIEVSAISGEEFIKARLHGGFKDIDYLETGFKGYVITLRILTRNGSMQKPILVSGELKKRFLGLINSGKVYG